MSTGFLTKICSLPLEFSRIDATLLVCKELGQFDWVSEERTVAGQKRPEIKESGKIMPGEIVFFLKRWKLHRCLFRNKDVRTVTHQT